MSEVVSCDGCGKVAHPNEARRLCDGPWFEVTGMGGGVVPKHACSPKCLETIGREMGGERP